MAQPTGVPASWRRGDLDQLQGDPGWLRDRREAAFAAFEKLPAPSKTDEEWRRTDVSRFDPSQYSKLEHLDG